jgi:hypothetical protein
MHCPHDTSQLHNSYLAQPMFLPVMMDENNVHQWAVEWRIGGSCGAAISLLSDGGGRRVRVRSPSLLYLR